MVIVSRDNRRLKELRRLKRGKDGDRVLLEGPHLVLEARRAGLEVDLALATPDFLASDAAAPVLAALPGLPLATEPRLLEDLADTESPRGLVAAAYWRPATLDDLPRPLSGPLVLVDGVQDPGNLGALARSAEAAGAVGIVLSRGSVQPRHPRALRASAGSLLRLLVVPDVTPGFPRPLST